MSRYLTLLLILTMLVPPLQAGGCESGHAAANHSAATSGGQSSSGLANPHRHHAGATVTQLASHALPAVDDQSRPENCCQAAGQGQPFDCDESADCGSCPTVPHFLTCPSVQSSSQAFAYRPVLSIGGPIPSHDYPPYRPPIS